MQLAQLDHQMVVLRGLGLQSLHELQPAHEPQPLSLDLRWTRPPPMLGIETPDPGLMKLRRFTQEPLGGERFAIHRLHVCCGKDTALLPDSPCSCVTVRSR